MIPKINLKLCVIIPPLQINLSFGCLLVCSKAFVPKKINLGSKDTNNATGPTIAAILAFVKNDAIRKQNGISDKLKRKKNMKTRNRLDRGRNELLQRNADETDIQKNKANAVMDQARVFTQDLSPIISIISFILVSFSSTTDFTSLETGYKVDTVNKILFLKIYRKLYNITEQKPNYKFINNIESITKMFVKINHRILLVNARPSRNPTWV